MRHSLPVRANGGIMLEAEGKVLVSEMLAAATTLHEEGYYVRVDSIPNQGGPTFAVRVKGAMIGAGLSSEYAGEEDPPDQDFTCWKRVGSIISRKAVTAPSGGLLPVLRQLMAEPPTSIREEVMAWLLDNSERLGIKVPDYQSEPDRDGVLVRFYPSWLPEPPLLVLAIDLCAGLRLVVYGASGGCSTGEPVSDVPLAKALETLVYRGRQLIRRYGEILANPELVIEEAELDAIANAMSMSV
jgi:hypothetical protein